MKHRLPKLFSCFLLCSLPLVFASCQGKQDFSDDVPTAELMDAVVEEIPVNFGYETFGNEHLRYYFKDTDLPDDVCIRYSVLSEDINEIGIFHTTSGEAQKQIKDLAEDYLEELREDQAAFIASYASEELPKLEHSEVRSFGNYTVYAIADDKDRELIFETVKKTLTKK